MTYWVPNQEEKILLINTWSDEFEFSFSFGTKIYEYIFEHNPNTKKLFPSIHKHGENWKNSDDFRNQSLKFAQVRKVSIS